MATPGRPKKQGEPPNPAPTVPDWREGGSRNERARLIREALFNAAGEIVGERGYQDASITLITQRAGVAQGTFYNHFESRQDILDKLLPALGSSMLEHVGHCSRQGETLIEREVLGFRGFFSFLKTHPHFFRILNEAPSFAPKAYQAHLEMVMEGYLRFFHKGRERGEIRGFTEQELEVVAFVLMGARLYLGRYATTGDSQDSEVPDWVIEAYRKLITQGLSGLGQATGA
ncbi:TetR/AcrR family transcriptional regulator [Bordetella sp. 15P40C-2]|uniref:TetR/AcrR family transcriptional regulator n=1 Tax=Bordetella sp. 15P40C-2 TaxID=2572246 RepID=UPI001325DA3B|nr:TetR/AcrR family transcriptional regulator [Bordetella sp. 15P40C-2]MVW70985.1 TetR family transcriptional regulator [Bordetella sp. 15P40C-2]